VIEYYQKEEKNDGNRDGNNKAFDCW